MKVCDLILNYGQFLLIKMIDDVKIMKSDSHGKIDGNSPAHTKPDRTHCLPHPAVLNNVDGPTISPNEVVNIALCINEIPVSFYSEPDWEVLAFP